MRKFLGSSLLAGIATGVIALGAPAAFAAGWTVTNSNADGTWWASLKPGTVATFHDVATNQSFTCTSSTIHGNALSGIGGPITITSGSFTGCSGPLGSTGSATISSGTINPVSYDSGTDTVNLNITGINAALTINSILGTCTGTVAGDIGTADNQDTYANATGTLTITADPAPQALKITSTSGSCAGLINAGDSVTFAATYVVTSPTPPLTVRPA